MFRIEDSDLKMITPHHLENTVFLMTETNRAALEKRSPMYGFDKDALNSIPPSERIIVSNLPQDPPDVSPAKINDAMYSAVKALFKGITDAEAREILGGDTVNYRGLEAQGITTAEQLRAAKGKLVREA
ncbi:SubName: Full=Uncharacterized protein {ECO:0000313/EMBL:CCA73198.1} [Serendipita indica DSM 11827]|nr:SubName: Full=Uncharacterized protein {ECO:0000313/EMBL:CCA73198.1} [Serendipita indica DSM 11827]